MRIFHSEFAHDYKTYAFGYEVHAELGAREDANPLYATGFLPRSNDPALTNRFYLARSVRVRTRDFSPTSENRRVLKKYDGRLTATELPRAALAKDAAFRKLFLSYFQTRHGVGIMSAARLDGILASVLPLRGVRYEENGKVAGYALEVAGKEYLHYWYPVYSPSYAKSCFGMWMMLDAVRRAKKEGRAHVYLGTAYGEKGRYKMNVSSLEYWDGRAWSADTKKLKALLASEATRVFQRSS